MLRLMAKFVQTLIANAETDSKMILAYTDASYSVLLDADVLRMLKRVPILKQSKLTICFIRWLF